MAYKPKVITTAEGGTGVASNTAYAVLTGGTTSTNPVQSIASVGTSGQVLTSNGASALPTFQAASASPYFGYATGQYYKVGIVGTNNASNVGMSAGDMYIVPMLIYAAITVDRVSININTGVAGNIRLGLYNTSNSLPTTVNQTFGTISTAGTGVTEVSGSFSIPAGAYYFAVQASANPTVVFSASSPLLWPLLPLGTAFASTSVIGYYYSTTYASGLPDLTGVTKTNQAQCPVINIRIV